MNSDERLPAPSAGSLLATSGLKKSFGETRALVDASVSLRRGEVVALMGENGSGKSTLVKIISGVLHADAGTVQLDGELVRLRSPRQALAHGIVTVFQEILVAPALNVPDNIFLGNGLLQNTRSARATRHARAAELLERLSPNPIDLGAPVGSLGLMEQQLCAIARAIQRKPKVLVLDEATSTLDVTVRDRLFELVREMCANAAAVFFISHRMGEVLSLADRITVLRGGQTAGTVDRSAKPEDLVRLMSGEGVQIHHQRRQRELAADLPPIMTASDVHVFPDSDPINVAIRRGEMIGLAGLEGQGQEEFLQILAGMKRGEGGAVEQGTAGVSRSVGSYRQAVRNGIVYIPRDRKVEGLAGNLSLVDNFAMPTYGRDGRLGVFRYGRTIERLDGFRHRLSFPAMARGPVGRLSGGNQQKVVLARWLALEPSVVLLNDPTRGVDHTTKNEIYDLLEELAESGVAVVMVSTEVEEHLALMDRTLVFRAGAIAAEFANGETDRDGLVAAFFGYVGQVRDTPAEIE